MKSLPQTRNPFLRALAIAAAIIVVGAGVVFSFFIFLALVGIVLVFAVIIGIRVWLLRRKLRKRASQRQDTGDFIEGDYEVKNDR